ncbi:MAG: hypothetical protein KDI30_05940 [Pseudomonadales bacterium]|nr:hypothetical protein [Pseudomonadales bacterium]
MAYQCRDCSHKGRQFPGGSCPACGSFNIGLQKKKPEKIDEKARKPFRISLMGVLWLFWAVLVYRKYFM